MNTFKTIALATALAVTTTTALAAGFGERGKWESGWAQGVSEYASGTRQGYLYFACRDGSVSSLMFVQPSGTMTETFILTVDGQPVQVHSIDTPAGRQQWPGIYRALRTGKNVSVTIGNRTYPVPGRDAARVIEPWGSKDFSCRP
ncbi:hypothetical protein [Laribacter hongkongensis]|uniref:hypothetical protein n=1 Tax=Laribacter hongkongensis TaxID=168471 RepID=UPI0018777FF7|nr:hypothetical protein [Laribacter hongkongensis]MBE5528701.1 hypothetical protein [Laribacter hongkongensis]MCG9040214.1 hypothetical protein [Laribacter hongkongensis]MCG9064445.1 hypothetical protein [Laribacter hongkongensis]MCG9067678.1 hypothetical protein [Laribacter hongkongensis]MCG9123593.1 hypothetical protein [Laribacter hongkongensis]